MGRRNKNVRRSNDKGRLARRERGQRPAKGDHSAGRVSLENLVIPDGRCYFQSRKGKSIFRTKEKAQTALDQAQLNRARQGTMHVEKRFYACPEGGCGGFHLTSRDEYDEEAARRRAEERNS
jgi:hypothetical protein